MSSTDSEICVDYASVGALNACRLAIAGKDGENGTFTNKEGSLPW